MRRSLVHRLAILAAVFGLLSIATGAFVTSGKAPDAQQFFLGSPVLHRSTGEVAVALMLVAAGGIFAAASLHRLRAFAGTAVVLGAAAGITSGTPVLHAFVAQIFFAAVASLALFTSAYWEKSAEPFDAKHWPALVPLASLTPFLVVIQIALGAGYRHKAFGVMPHMGGAMLVTMTILCLCVFVMQSLPGNRSLGKASMTALIVTLIQVTLGVVVFVMGLLDVDNTLAAIVSAAAHVSTGALTLAASSFLAIQIRRSAAA
jgi:heme A synthase